MKKYLFIVFAIALGATATAQKKLYIYNLSSNDVTVSDILTKHVTSEYPKFEDNVSNYIIPAITGNFELSNSSIPTYRFPFLSFADPIPNWYRHTSATTANSVPAAVATTSQSSASNNQIFHCIKYTDGYETGVVGTTPLGNPEVVLTDTSAYYEPYIAGTLIEYTIVILDN